MRAWTRNPRYLADYAAATATVKGITEQSGRDAVLSSVSAAFNNIYKAVAFDIDGTLTGPAGVGIDPDMAGVIVDLLARGVSVYLITGRGRGGARSAAAEILRAATAGDTPTHLVERALRRLHAMSSNGAFLLSTSGYGSRDILRAFLRDETLLVDPGPVQQWHDDVRSVLQNALPEGGWTMEERAEPASVRIRNDSEATQSAVIDALRPWLESVGNPQLGITAGTYAGFAMVDVGVVNKGQAVKQCAARLGVKEQEVLRLGDHGERDGNDYDLLKSVAGFSVDRVSSDPYSCHPVLGDSFERLTGAIATRHLLTQLYLFPPLSVTNVSLGNYRKRFAEFEDLATRRSREESAMIEKQLTVRFGQLFSDSDRVAGGSITPSDLFDDRSGAVRLSNWELERLRDEPEVWKLFDLGRLERTSEADTGPRWCMFSDSSVLLRGPHYYRSESEPRRRHPDLVESYIDDILTFVSGTYPVLTKMRMASRPEPDLLAIKVYAGIVDNVRNAILQLTHLALQLAEPDAGPCAADRELVTRMGTVMVLPHTRRHIELLFDSNLPWRTTLERYEDTLRLVEELLRELRSELPARYAARANDQPDWYRDFCNSKEAFKWREADHILQNVAAIQMGMRRLVTPGTEDCAPWAIGLTYGGLELPALAAALGERIGRPVKPAVAHVSLYNDAKAGQLVRSGSERYIAEVLATRGPVLPLVGSPPSGESGIEFDGDSAIILDDNNTTAQTLQLARDLLVFREADVLGAVIVRFPGANRTAHMAMPNHGFLDLDVAFSFVWGFVASSPYTRLVVPGQLEESRYQDENGVFDKARQRIRYLLRKNDPTAFPDGVTPTPRDLMNETVNPHEEDSEVVDSSNADYSPSFGYAQGAQEELGPSQPPVP